MLKYRWKIIIWIKLTQKRVKNSLVRFIKKNYQFKKPIMDFLNIIIEKYSIYIL